MKTSCGNRWHGIWPNLSSTHLLVVALLALVCPAGNAPAAEVEKYLPDATEVVLVINARDILDSAVFRKFVRGPLDNSLKDNPETEPLAGLLQGEALKGLSQVIVAFPPGPAERKGMVVVRGRLDLARLKPIAEALARNTPLTIKIQPADKVPLYEILVDDPPTLDLFAAFPEEGVAVFSPSRNNILDAIAKGAGRKVTRLDKDFQALLAQAETKQSIWLAGRIPEQIKKDLGNRPQLKAFAGKMVAFRGGLRLTDGVKASFFLQMADEQAAVDFRQALDLAKNLANLYVSGTPALKDAAPVINEVLESVQLTRQKALLGIEVTVSEAQIEKGVKPKPNP